MQFLQKMLFYMNGRYGLDELSKVLMAAGLLLNIVSNFVGGMIVSVFGIALIAYALLRVLSKEKTNRYKEYRYYITIKQKWLTKVQKLRNKQAQRKVYKVLACPECKQSIRVPKGKGKIRITCPNCKNQFVKKT
ncbi:hypothetical protein [Marinilactibacillus kalidii]|uniref:hypothetical protein n=1 Tax=Marinilactibacillus kalidii TaxID=2820274 RepID=UPI001ABDB453|nr:hypothetical protein [Marinilactibacillus kalidii]